MPSPPPVLPDTERRLVEDVYTVVLPGRVVGPQDDFFELGGDSIGLVRLVALTQRGFGVEIDAREFFASPTLATLTALVGRAAADLEAQVASLTDGEVQQMVEARADPEPAAAGAGPAAAPPRAGGATGVRGHWIGGRWLPPSSDDTIDVVDPSTEEVLAAVPAGTAADVGRAVAAASAAFPGWAATPPPERLRFLERLLTGFQARADEFADVLTAEIGVPTTVARRAHVGLAAGLIASYLEIVPRFEWAHTVGNSRVFREPRGVVGCITPWNMPLLLIVQKLAPAIAAGCTVVLKPSEIAPLNAYLLAEVIAECDLPPGVFNLVVGDGPTAGAELARHPGVDMVSYTGSIRAGREISRLGADSVKVVNLELGGKNASIVLEDADLSAAVRATVDQAMFNTGQTCLAWSRLLVPRQRHDEAVSIAVAAAAGYRVGDPRDPATHLGPLASAGGYRRVRDHVRAGVGEGAVLRSGGAGPVAGLSRGYYLAPTVFSDVRPEMTIAREEIFGPVLCVMPYDGPDDAVRIANDTPYGLHGAVWSDSEERALHVAGRLRTGVVDVNGGQFNLEAPFGGYKQSGTGRECGVPGLDGFLETKSVQLPAAGPELTGPRLRETSNG